MARTKKYLTKEVPGQWRSLWLDVTVDAELAGGDYAIVIETETEDGEKGDVKSRPTCGRCVASAAEAFAYGMVPF